MSSGEHSLPHLNQDIDDSGSDSDTSVDTMSDNLRSNSREMEIDRNSLKEIEREERVKEIEKESGKSVNNNLKTITTGAVGKVSKEKLNNRNDNSDYDNDDPNEDENKNFNNNENDVDIDVDDNNTENNHYVIQSTVWYTTIVGAVFHDSGQSLYWIIDCLNSYKFESRIMTGSSLRKWE